MKLNRVTVAADEVPTRGTADTDASCLFQCSELASFAWFGKAGDDLGWILERLFLQGAQQFLRCRCRFPFEQRVTHAKAARHGTIRIGRTFLILVAGSKPRQRPTSASCRIEGLKELAEECQNKSTSGYRSLSE